MTTVVKTNIQFDIYDDKGRQLGLAVAKFDNGTDYTYKQYRADLHQTRNNKTYGGSFTSEYFDTESELDEFVNTKVPELEKKYAKQWRAAN